MLTSVQMVPITATQMLSAPTQMDLSHVLANKVSKGLEHPVLVNKDPAKFHVIYISSFIQFSKF